MAAHNLDTLLAQRQAHDARVQRRLQVKEQRKQERAIRSPRLIDVQNTKEGLTMTIRARSELRSVGRFLCLIVAFIGSLFAAFVSRQPDLIWLWPALTWLLVGMCHYPWPMRVLLTEHAYAIYRWPLPSPLRVGPRSELSVRNADWHGPRLRVSVKRRFCFEFWGLKNPRDRQLIASFPAKGDV